jgi:arginine/lysine/ornithine decarboxylase
MISPYPRGVPVVAPGEIVDRDVVPPDILGSALCLHRG